VSVLLGWTSFERVVLHFRFRDRRRGLVCGFVILEASWGVPGGAVLLWWMVLTSLLGLGLAVAMAGCVVELRGW